MAGSIREIFGTLKLKDEATKSVEKLDKGMDEAKDSVVDVQDALKALGGAVIIGVLKSLASEFITAFATLETQQTRLENMSGDTYPELIGSINDAIKASQGLSNEGDMTTAVNQAIKYGASVELITGSLSELQQLSAITGDDLSSVMQGLSKDIATGSTRFIQQNPILVKHIDAFRKMGVGYDEATKKRRELFVLDLLQEESIEIQKQYNKTLEDTNALLAVSESQWGNIKERIGAMLVEGLKPLLKIGNTFLIWLGESEAGLQALKFMLITITPLIGVALVWALKSATVFAWSFIAPFLPFIAIGLAVGAVIAGIAFVIEDLVTWLDGGESAFGSFWQMLADFWNWMKDGFLGGLLALGGVLGLEVKQTQEILGLEVKQTQEMSHEVKQTQEMSQASRAGGGSVTGGGSFIVGEKGPEVFTPGISGQITPMGGSQNNVSMTIGPFYVNGSEETAREVESAVLNALNSLSNNIFRSETGVPIFG